MLRGKNFNFLLMIVCNSKFIKYSLFKRGIVLEIKIKYYEISKMIDFPNDPIIKKTAKK